MQTTPVRYNTNIIIGFRALNVINDFTRHFVKEEAVPLKKNIDFRKISF